MPRNSSGVYSLPAGNPVVTATVISSTWANNTLSDIGAELTQSLDRSGDGGMLASLKLFDGLIGAPGLSWTTEPTSGLYRVSAGVFAYSIAAADKLQITTNGLRSADGVVGTPGFSFIADTDTGIYRIGANDLGIATGGTLRLEINSAGTASFSAATAAVTVDIFGTEAAGTTARFAGPNTGVGWNIIFRDTTAGANRAFLGIGTNTVGGAAVTDFGISPGAAGSIIIGTANGAAIGTRFGPSGHIRTIDGVAATPAFTFELDPDTGIYRAAANTVGVSANGVLVADFRNTTIAGLVMDLGSIFLLDGVVGTPALTFGLDQDTGIYRSAANRLNFSCGATDTLQLTSTIATLFIPFQGQDGNVGTPGISFQNDSDTGIYRIGANAVGIALGGALRFSLDNATGIIDFSGMNQINGFTGSVATPTYSFAADTDTGIYRVGSNNVGIVGGGLEIASFSHNAGSPIITLGVGSAGTNTLNLTGLTTSTSATTGAATALPANPRGYLSVTIQGTSRKIPYYDV